MDVNNNGDAPELARKIGLLTILVCLSVGGWCDNTVGPVVQYTLEVDGASTGAGNVTSSPAGISCTIIAGSESGDCDEEYDENTQVTLTATPSCSSSFTGWSGACSGTGTCQVTMSAAQSVMALFIGDYVK